MLTNLLRVYPVTLGIVLGALAVWALVPNPHALALAEGSGAWSWILCHFVHTDASHLFLDLLSVMVIGFPLESLIKRSTLLFLLVGSLPVLSFSHRVFDPESAVMGISGVQHVMTGALIGALILRKQFVFALLLSGLEVLTVSAAIHQAGSFDWISRHLFKSFTLNQIAHHLHIAGCLYGLGFVLLVSTVPKLIKRSVYDEVPTSSDATS